MEIHVHIHDDRHTKGMLEKILENQHSIITKTNQIMASQAQVAQQLTTLSTQLDKALTEIQTQIQALTDAVAAAGNSTPEVDAAIAALGVSAQKLDDLNADPSTGGTGGTTPPTP